jgi:hypothetical protein
MLVGHNPAATYLAEFLTRAEIWLVAPTGGVVYMTFEGQKWAEVTGSVGQIGWFEYPRQGYRHGITAVCGTRVRIHRFVTGSKRKITPKTVTPFCSGYIGVTCAKIT